MKNEIKQYLYSMFSVQCTYRLQGVCVQKKCTFGWCMGFSGVRLMIFNFAVVCGNVCDSTVFTVKYTNFVLVYQNYFVKSKICIWLECLSFSCGVCSVFGPWFSLCWCFNSTGVFELRMSSPWPTPQPGRSGYLSLSNSSLVTYLAWVAIPAASLLPA